MTEPKDLSAAIKHFSPDPADAPAVTLVGKGVARVEWGPTTRYVVLKQDPASEPSTTPAAGGTTFITNNFEVRTTNPDAVAKAFTEPLEKAAAAGCHRLYLEAYRCAVAGLFLPMDPRETTPGGWCFMAAALGAHDADLKAPPASRSALMARMTDMAREAEPATTPKLAIVDRHIVNVLEHISPITLPKPGANLTGRRFYLCERDPAGNIIDPLGASEAVGVAATPPR